MAINPRASTKYQYSLLEALPLKSTYFIKPDLAASIKLIYLG
jgi:hypothetical protein